MYYNWHCSSKRAAIPHTSRPCNWLSIISTWTHQVAQRSKLTSRLRPLFVYYSAYHYTVALFSGCPFLCPRIPLKCTISVVMNLRSGGPQHHLFCLLPWSGTSDPQMWVGEGSPRNKEGECGSGLWRGNGESECGRGVWFPKVCGSSDPCNLPGDLGPRTSINILES